MDCRRTVERWPRRHSTAFEIEYEITSPLRRTGEDVICQKENWHRLKNHPCADNNRWKRNKREEKWDEHKTDWMNWLNCGGRSLCGRITIRHGECVAYAQLAVRQFVVHKRRLSEWVSKYHQLALTRPKYIRGNAHNVQPEIEPESN